MKLWKRLFAFALALVLCAAIVPQPYADAAYTTYTSSSTLATKMKSVYNSWNNKDYSWNYKSASQCAAFTRYMFYNIYGHTDNLEGAGNQVGLYHASSLTEMANIIQTCARQGDAVRVSACSGYSDTKGSQNENTHIFILVSAGQDSLKRYDSNFDAYNKARDKEATYKDIAKYNAGYSADAKGSFGGKIMLIKVIHAPENKVANSGIKVTVKADSAQSVSASSAKLTGSVMVPPDVTATKFGVCVGTSANPTSIAQSSDVKSSSGDKGSDKEFSATYTKSGLKAGTTYHYRFYAQTSSGTYYSSDATFTTTSTSTSTSTHTHSYNSVGKCTICSQTFPLNITTLNQKMKVTSVNNSGTAPAHTTPYGDATITKRYSKGQEVTVTGSAKNYYGNLWYRLSDGTWITSSYLSIVKPEEPVSGATYIFTNKASGKALDVAGNVSKSTNKSNVHIYTDIRSNKSEQFKLIKTSGGWFNMMPLSNTGLAVNPFSAKPANGTNVNVYTLNAKDNTMGWIFESVGGYYVIRSAYNKSLVLTATGTANQSNVKLATYSANNSYQLWSIIKV